MSDPNPPVEAQREWHVLSHGERLGPFTRAELRAQLDTHPERWSASVWRPGMLDWRPAESVAILTVEAPVAEPPLQRSTAPLEDPRLVGAAGLRNTAGELRVLSYAALKALPRELFTQAAQAAAQADAPALSGEWATVATSELLAIATSELRGLSVRALSPAETSEWATVATSELRAIGTSEFRAFATTPPSAPVTSALRAVTTREAALGSSLPSIIVSEATALELASYRPKAEPPPPACEPDTPTKPELPVSRRRKASRAPSRAPVYVLCGLLVGSAIALGTAVTLRLWRAAEGQLRREHAYASAPMPPAFAAPPRASAQAAVLPAAAEPPRPEAIPVAALEAPPSPPRRRARRVHETSAASRAGSVRVNAAWAPVRVGNDAASPVVCSLPRGTVLAVLAELPDAHARWFAVRCNAQGVGWVQETYLDPLAR